MRFEFRIVVCFSIPAAWFIRSGSGIKPPTCDMLHFAYGSNMSAALMRRRCPGARLEGCAHLPGYRFTVMRSGYASVVPAPGSIVHGVLWRLAPRDVAALNAYGNLDGAASIRRSHWR